MSDPYHDIRPYNDAEVEAVLARLGSSPELLRALVGFQFPYLPAWTCRMLTRVTGWRLRRHLTGVRSVVQFQDWLREWVTNLVQGTTSAVTVRGLEKLPRGAPYLWLSNHRDIAMDPTMINFALMQSAWPTAQIAIGDNLLQNPVLADVMRLNKAFIVKRSATMGKREKLTEMQRLSGYIRDALGNGHSVWLAQREGRAKDSRDHTDTAVLKMLALSGREDELSFTAAMARLHPVPVAVHYEWDPCDLLKARELVALARDGRYVKAPGEDTRSLLLGLRGAKGQVTISFGEPLSAEQLVDARTMADATDRIIARMTPVYPVSHTALYLLQSEFGLYNGLMNDPGMVTGRDAQELLRRCEGEEDAVRIRLLTNYAAPLIPVTERSEAQ